MFTTVCTQEQLNWRTKASKESKLDYKLAFEQYRADKMGDGFNQDEPSALKFCEVIQIGIEDDTAEVTIFYTPERGLSL